MEWARLDRNKLIQDKDLFCPDIGAGNDFLPACERAQFPGFDARGETGEAAE